RPAGDLGEAVAEVAALLRPGRPGTAGRIGVAAEPRTGRDVAALGRGPGGAPVPVAGDRGRCAPEGSEHGRGGLNRGGEAGARAGVRGVVLDGVSGSAEANAHISVAIQWWARSIQAHGSVAGMRSRHESDRAPPTNGKNPLSWQ